MRKAPFVLAVAMLAVPALDVLAGEFLGLAQKVFDADLILEIGLPLDEPIPSTWPNQKYDPKGHAFPGALIDRARRAATVERVLKNLSGASAPAVPEDVYVFSSGTPCWWKAHSRKSLRTLVFLAQSTNGTRTVAGVEHESGLYTDLNPAYEQLVEAIQQAGAWPEERMRAVGADQLWLDQREVLRSSKSPYLPHLAAEFLRAHDAASVVDEIWGSIGSDERKQREASTRLTYESVCKP